MRPTVYFTLPFIKLVIIPLIEQACTLHKRLHPYRRLQLRVNHRMNHSFAEHSEILEAIFAGNEQEAEALLKAHVVIQGEKFTDFISTLERLKL